MKIAPPMIVPTTSADVIQNPILPSFGIGHRYPSPEETRDDIRTWTPAASCGRPVQGFLIRNTTPPASEQPEREQEASRPEP